MSELKLPELFGSRVFNEETMKERLSGACYQAWKRCVTDGASLELAAANEIAGAMKTWAVERGCTHYTHWFQPMTGFTAEKHDSFIAPAEGGRVILEFSGKNLVRGEADASSFPSGGLRATFEARGYTAWDPSSFAFIKEGTLCIPTILCSYGGHALDKKTPLLRSMEDVSRQAIRILRLFGDTESRRVIPCVGPEQEYFLVDKKMYNQREDLRMTGRTLFGAKPPRGQELDDHYYGAIRPRVAAFMKDLDENLWALGIYSKTKHNEAAPAQHEMAPVYTDANTACDHNQLTMEVMKKIAEKHDLVCLLDEKPFAGVNGSGKHDNWSLNTDTGKNLFKPGKTPSQNAQFLLFLAAFVKGVDEYQDFLRATVAFPGNDHRLGASEAPPAVLSIFLGDELDAIVQSIIRGTEFKEAGKRTLQIGVDAMPPIPQDNTDRNRTSPMAFTGNKFEFRMVGSQDSVAAPNIVLNTIVAEAFQEACEILENAEDFDVAVHDLIKTNCAEHQRIIFNGNGYSDAWVEEAKRRGLPNIRSMVDAIPALTTEKSIAMFEHFHVFTKTELESRTEVKYETYAKEINVEARAMIDIAAKQIIPAVIKYAKHLADAIISIQTIPGMDVSVETELLKETTKLLRESQTALKTLQEKTEAASLIENNERQARYYHDEVNTAMEALRKPIDQLEMIVDKEMWPMPSYGDLMFEV